MPRIRTLKPEHKLHRKVGGLSHVAYRLWVGLVTEADDDGRLVCDVAQLRAVVFGLRPDTTTAHVERALREILISGLAVRYPVNGTRYLALPSYREHQKIDRPRPSTLPPPPGRHSTTPRRAHRHELPNALDEPSTKTRRALDEPSTSARARPPGGARVVDEPSTSARRGSDRILGKKERPSTNPRGRVHRASPVPRGGSDDLSITRSDGPEPVAAVLARIGFVTSAPEPAG